MASDETKDEPGSHQKAANQKIMGAAPRGDERPQNDANETKSNTETKKSYWRDCLKAHTFLEYFNAATLFLAFVAAAFAAGYAASVAKLTEDLARDSAANLDSSTRAYIAITGVKWDGTPVVGKNQRIKILFKNVGKEAASHFTLFVRVSNQFNFEPDSKGMPFVPPDKVEWPYVECRGDLPGAKIIGQRPVYPDVQNEAIWYAFNPGGSTPNAVFVPQRLLDGKTTIVVSGCALYRTLGKTRHSPFCFYYQPVRGGDVDKGTFEWCPTGASNAT